MRLYVFGNLYISPIQHGIQGIHSFGELVLKLLDPLDSKGLAVLRAFLADHKTVIALNGGYASTLSAIHDRLAAIAADWPSDLEEAPVLLYAKFHEEDAALNGALTSVAAVVPSCAYFDHSQPSQREAQMALRLRATDRGHATPFDASADRDGFTATERLALLCMNFPLA